MSEQVFHFDTIELDADKPLIFVNDGMDEEMFGVVRELESEIADYIDLSQVSDYETAEPLIDVIQQYLEDQGFGQDEEDEESDEEDFDLQVLVSRVTMAKFGGNTFLIVGVMDLEYEPDESDGDFDDEDDFGDDADFDDD